MKEIGRLVCGLVCHSPRRFTQTKALVNGYRTVSQTQDISHKTSEMFPKVSKISCRRKCVFINREKLYKLIREKKKGIRPS